MPNALEASYFALIFNAWNITMMNIQFRVRVPMALRILRRCLLGFIGIGLALMSHFPFFHSAATVAAQDVSQKIQEHIQQDSVSMDAQTEQRLILQGQLRRQQRQQVSALAVDEPTLRHIVGQWSGVESWPVLGVHATLMANGKVLAFDSVGDNATETYQNHSFTRATVWDPVTNQHTDVRSDTGYNLFCSGHANLPDGRVYIAGGNLNSALQGTNTTHFFYPSDNTWLFGPRMLQGGRWYPSVTSLANGEMLITEGGPDIPEVRGVTGSLRSLTNASQDLPLYPWLQVAPDGRTFYAGPSDSLQYLNTAGTGSWQNQGGRDGIDRDYGSYAMYDIGKLLIAGGGFTEKSAAVIDLNNGGQLNTTGSMKYARRQHNLTVLADGSVLATGGLSSQASLVDLNAGVYAAELWNPATGQWLELASMQVTRQYHSSALLLPDGRVLSAGGGICGACQSAGYLEKNAEIFTPPYLFNKDGSGTLATRPTIDVAPTTVGYGQSFAINTAQAGAITKVAMIRLGSVTHSVNMEQRYVPLNFAAIGGQLAVTAPANANVAPPGYYMLFIMDTQGVPSIAKFVRIDSAVDGGGAGTGLTGQYFNNTSLSGIPVLQRSEAIDFNWRNGSPGAGINVDNYSVRWSGQVEAPVSGTYQFQTLSDDGVRMWVNGTQVINNWTDHAPTINTSSSVNLSSGVKYNVTVEFYEKGGGATARLAWLIPGSSAFMTVPINRLYAGSATPSTTKLWLEAELGSLSSPMQNLTDTTASNGRYIAVSSGRNSINAPPTNGIATYTFNATTAGTYKVWGRTIAPSGNDDSFWVQVDNGKWYKWNRIPVSTAWRWDDVHNDDAGGTPVTWNLAIGQHTLKVAYREDGTRLDRILITDDLNFVPSGVGG
jgi:hypothetical protein